MESGISIYLYSQLCVCRIAARTPFMVNIALKVVKDPPEEMMSADIVDSPRAR